ncbi:MAG: hypothetical protein ABSE73_18270 [Planctomycetota bacterium]
MSESNGLPKGWVRTTLGTIHQDHAVGITPGDEPERQFELYSVPSFPAGIPEIVLGKDVGSSKQKVAPDAVLVCKINPRINRIWVVGNHTNFPKIASTEWIPFWPVSEILPHYLCYYLRQHSFRDYLAANASGVGGSLMRVKAATLASYPLCLPPHREQRRIVAKIEELFSDLDAGVAALERVKANLKRYRAAVLKAAVEGKLTEKWRAEHPNTEPASKLLERILAERRKKWEASQLAKFAAAGKEPPKNWRDKYQEPAAPDTANLPKLPKGWCWATVEQMNIAERPVSYGVLQPGPDLSDGVPLIRVGDVADGKVAVDQLKRIAPEISAQYQRTIVQGGEVLLTIVGTIGRTAVVPQSASGANTARAVAVIPVTPLTDSRYVELCLRDPRMRARLTGAAHEVARKTLNLEDVRPAAIPFAPSQEQAQVIAEAERRLSVVEQNETALDHGIARASRLRQSILKRAFEGKLVPQDPQDEPASVLLERIKAERDGNEHAKPFVPKRGRRGSGSAGVSPARSS